MKYQIQTLNKIAKIGLNEFTADYVCGDQIENPDAILVRSASMHDMEMPASLLAIARAGAGVNNIPVDQCTEKGIVVFNTPGANANAVKELVLGSLFLASRDIVGGIEWVKTLKGSGDQVSKLVEKGKSSFVGPEIAGKTLGVIGLGAIGVLVANTALDLGMKVYGYDPYLSVDTAWRLSNGVKHAMALEEIFTECDYITIHVPATPSTKNMINAETIATMKDQVRILNFARGDLVNSADLIEAVKAGKIGAYVTDFPTDEMLDVKGIVPVPHLGASTPESEDNCAVMAANELRDFIENGNIRNSVNLPNVSLARSGNERICVIHKNIPNVIAKVSDACSQKGLNIENMQSASKKDYAYMVVDITGSFGDVSSLLDIEGVIRVRVID